MFSPGDFLVSLSALQAREEAQEITATSGRKCSVLFPKSSPIGLLLKTLLESYRWWSPARQLKWTIKPIYSMKTTIFTDTDTTKPTPLNKSAKTLKVFATPSNRLLYQLALLEPLTEDTESSSSRLLTTPTTFDTKELKSWNTKQCRGTLAQQAMMGKLDSLLPTHLVQGLKVCENGKTTYVNPTLLPTPMACEADHFANKFNQKSQMGHSLNALAINGLLPTPTTSGEEHYETKCQRKGHKQVMSQLASAVEYLTESAKDGKTSQLSPLFTEEMMGFPYLWTLFPFLGADGETKP